MVKEYFLDPHFNAPAPPRGVVKLGTILGRLDNSIHSTWRNFSRSQLRSFFLWKLKNLLGTDWPGLAAPDRRPEGDHRVISCKHLDTLAFIPTESYVRDTIDNLDDESYKPSSRSKPPVYMVTGLKIARGASYSSRVSNRESVVQSSFRESDDFIVAFKVVQVWLDRKGRGQVQGIQQEGRDGVRNVG
ncbi:uncharacterized protein FFB14_01819 [Fusarium fujikuroi]|nr:uncharacterized protein FFB14_01819 [Fusarium fujikuroi]